MTDQTFEDLTARLKVLLKEEYQRQRLNMAGLMALLFSLGQAKNTPDLVNIASAFSKNFPVIDIFLAEIRSHEKKSLEQDVSAIIQKMLVSDPIKAASIAKDALSGGMTLEKLMEKYPEIQNYL